MGKKMISLILSLSVLLSLSFALYSIAFAVEDDAGTYGDNITYSFDAQSGVLTVSGTGDMKNTTTTGAPWYPYRTSIKSIVIEEGITGIGRYCFYYANAESVSFPSTLIKIGNRAFSHCSAITSLELPEGLETLEPYVFENCTGITSLVLPSSLVTIGAYVFCACSSLTTLSFSSMSCQAQLGNYAFADCSLLQNAVIPSEVTFADYSPLGFSRNGETQYDLTISGYKDSPAYYYAVAKGFNFVELGKSYTVLNLAQEKQECFVTDSETFLYLFTPSESGNYVIYSQSSIDIYANLYTEDMLLIQSNDDASDANRDFKITAFLEKDKPYYISVGANKMVGDFRIIVMPEIKTLSVSLNQTDPLIYGIDSVDGVFDIEPLKERISFVINGVYTYNYSDELYLYADNCTVYDNQKDIPWTYQGENPIYLTVENTTASCSVAISEHSFEKVVKEATCLEEGAEYLYCSHCSEIRNYVSGEPALGHDFEVKSTVNATYERDGYDLCECTRCGLEEKQNIVPKTGRLVKGNIVLLENIGGVHNSNIPLEGISIYFDGRVKTVTDSSGYFELYVPRLNAVVTVKDSFGQSRSISIMNGHTELDLGFVPFLIYDINNDGAVNARDYSKFLTLAKDTSNSEKLKIFDVNKDGSLNSEDWVYAKNFIPLHYTDENLYN